MKLIGRSPTTVAGGNLRKAMTPGALLMALLVQFSLAGPCLSPAFAANPELTPEFIRLNEPELYRQIQSAPKLPLPTDPNNPYGEYAGFFSHPKFQPDQPEDWWEHSSFSYNPQYPYLLKHTHLKFSYADMEGNDNGFAVKGGAYLAVRKGRVSSYLGYEVDRKEITDSQGGSVDKDIQNLDTTLLYEINPHLFVEGGLIWQRLSYQMIDSRTIPFVGLGSFNILKGLLDPKRDSLKVGFGFGRIYDKYDQTVIDMIGKDSDSFNGAYVKANFIHQFTDTLAYRQSYVLKHALQETTVYKITTIPQTDMQFAINAGSTKRYDWRWTNALEFTLNQWVGFLIQYQMAYDSNPWPIAAKSDKELLLGLKFAY